MRKENSYYTMNHTVEDLSLLNALRQGDGNAFDHLFRRYYPMLCAYAHRLVSLEDAEEIVQEVMLWLWENRGDLIIESSLNQYLFKMTYRRVLNHLTREQVKTKAEAAFYEREALERRYLQGYELYDKRQLRKMTHLERVKNEILLFDYQNRSLLTNQAAVHRIQASDILSLRYDQ